MKLYIKHMVSQRCKLLVKEEIQQLGLHCTGIELGVVDIRENLNEQQQTNLKNRLVKWGFELMDNSKTILTERIKNVVVDMIYYKNEMPKVNYSAYISEKLHYNYTYLSNLFSEEKGMTIQQYIILSKIERVKELLLYGELTLTEISYNMHYSSVAHLSNQFKKITGFSPTYYRQHQPCSRGNLEDM